MPIAIRHNLLLNGNMNLPEKLRRLMKMRGLSQTRLARAIGRHQTTVGAWCRGVNSPTLEDGRLLADALNVPLDYLADDSADEPKPPEFTADERQLIRDARMIGIAEARRRILLAPPAVPDNDPPFVGVATIERATVSRSGGLPERTDPRTGPTTMGPETPGDLSSRKGPKSGSPRR